MSYSDECIICGDSVNKEEKHWQMEQWKETDADGDIESERICETTFYICNECGDKLLRGLEISKYGSDDKNDRN